MKTKVFTSLIALLVITIALNAQQQSLSGNKYTLLTTPYNKRPLTLYRGQFQINTGYQFAVRARQFDSEGKKVILKDLGVASVYHYYMIELKYGVNNFLELSATTNYLKRGIRSQTVNYVSSTESISVTNLDEQKGIGDILLLATTRLPFQYRWFDLAVRGGAYIPSAEYKPEKPTHSIRNVLSTNVYDIDYHYNSRIGYGVPVYVIGGALKFSYSNLSVESEFSFSDPVEEGENIRWDETLTASRTFDYTSKSYDYLLNTTYDFNAALYYQAAGWFNMGLNVNYFKSSGGWTEYRKDKYRNPEQSTLILEPEFEIQITPSIRIFQTAGFPVSGKNIDAPFYLYITLSFNTFPFLR